MQRNLIALFTPLITVLVPVVTLSTLLASLAVYAQGTPDGETPANEGVCDELMGGTPGLYGLCVGFCEAQDCEATFNETTGDVTFDASCKPSSTRLLANYNKRVKTSARVGQKPSWMTLERGVLPRGPDAAQLARGTAARQSLTAPT